MDELEVANVEYIIIHHSSRNFDCPLFIKLRHKYLRGWSDTGYHFIIGNGILCKDGEVYRARSTKYVGAHAYGYNKKSIGICLIGNFDSNTPTDKQYQSLISLIRSLQIDFKINKVIGHIETGLSKKSCPGKYFFLDRFRSLLKTNS